MPIVRNTKTNVVSSVPRHYIGHPVLGANLVLVDGEEKTVAPITPKKGNITKESKAPEVAPESVQPEETTN